jgi:hypothetical protein
MVRCHISSSHVFHSSDVNTRLANVLINRKSLSTSNIRKFISLLRDILARRNEFLAKHKVEAQTSSTY